MELYLMKCFVIRSVKYENDENQYTCSTVHTSFTFTDFLINYCKILICVSLAKLLHRSLPRQNLSTEMNFQKLPLFLQVAF